jgi:hypothetical protein
MKGRKSRKKITLPIHLHPSPPGRVLPQGFPDQIGQPEKAVGKNTKEIPYRPMISGERKERI